MNLHQQQHQPMHASMVSLALILGWLFAGYLFIGEGVKLIPMQEPYWFTEVNFYNLFIDWKLFTIIAFIFGIRAYIFSETGRHPRFFYFRSLIWAVTALILSIINCMSLVIIPLLFFGALLFFLRNTTRWIPYFFMLLLLIGLLLTSWFGGIPNFGMQCFTELTSYQLLSIGFPEMIKQLTNPSNIITWLYGCLVMILGYLVGKGKWLIEYHFRYPELKRLFILSAILFVLWAVLNHYKIYQMLYSWKGGELFYLLDAVAVQLLTLFMYLFILIYLENFRWGLFIIRLFTKIGKLWLFNLFAIFGSVGLFSLLQVNISMEVAIIAGLLGFSFFGGISVLIYPLFPESFRSRVY